MTGIEIEKLTLGKLDEETNDYILCVLSIYKLIENKVITVPEVLGKKDSLTYKLNKNDKRIMALFLGGIISKGIVRNVFYRYEDIRKKDLLNYLQVNVSDIMTLNPSDLAADAKELYDSTFKPELFRILQAAFKKYEIKKITPTAIIAALRFSFDTGSDIIERFFKTYGIEKNNVWDTTIFKSMLAESESRGYIVDTEKQTFHHIFSGLPGEENFINNFIKKQNELNLLDVDTVKRPSPKPLSSEEKSKKDILKEIQEKSQEIMGELKKAFIGQEDAAKEILLNIINNHYLRDIDPLTAKQKSVMLIDGSSGTGKTAIANHIAAKVGIPCVKKSVTSFSKIGYHGASITDLLGDLLEQAGGDLEKAQHGIIMLEEIDKLAVTDPSREVMKRDVQLELIDFIGGGKYTIDFGGKKIEFDTSNLTFIGIGSFSELRSKKVKEAIENYEYQEDDAKVSLVYQDEGLGEELIGYTVDYEEPTEETIDIEIAREDLIDLGFNKDLANRFNTFIHTVDYDEKTLKRILLESSTSPLLGLKNWIIFFNKSVVTDDNFIDALAHASYELKAGERGNEIMIDNIRSLLLEEVLLGQNKVVHLTANLVDKAKKKISSRPGRK